MSSAAPASGRPVSSPARHARACLAWLLHWPARARRTGQLAAIAVFLPAMLAAVFYSHLVRSLWGGSMPLNDFFAFWSWSAMTHILVHPLAIYTPATVQAFLHGEEPAFHGHYPFAYPPSFLLLTWPLALVSRPLAYGIWSVASLAAYLAAMVQKPWRRPIALLTLFAPATALTLETGQDGLLMAALLYGGCRLLPRRPVLAGVLFGLLSCKPQFGLLLPVALLAARQWRTIAAAAATVLATVIASAAAFGWGMWGRWVAALWQLSSFVAGRARLYPLMPTVTGTLHQLGVGPLPRVLVQAAATLLAGLCVWLCWRRGPGRLPSAVLQVGCFLATPYAFCFDLPIMTGALLNVVLERAEADAAFGLGEVLVLFAAVLLPALMAAFHGPVPWSALVLPPLFALIVARAHRAMPGTGPAHPPGSRTGPAPLRWPLRLGSRFLGSVPGSAAPAAGRASEAMRPLAEWSEANAPFRALTEPAHPIRPVL